jgi:hypothetical protein
VTNIRGSLKGIFNNPPKDITTKEWKAVTIPEKFVIVLEEGETTHYIEVGVDAGTQLKGLLNSLLSVEIGEFIEISTYLSGGKYKVIWVSNPNKKKEVESNGKKVTVNESYPWAIDNKDIPQATVIRHPKTDALISIDDSEVTAFFKEKINAKFGGGAKSPDAIDDTIDGISVPF